MKSSATNSTAEEAKETVQRVNNNNNTNINKLLKIWGIGAFLLVSLIPGARFVPGETRTRCSSRIGKAIGEGPGSGMGK